LISFVAGGTVLEVIWQEAPEQDARLVESELLLEYLLDHHELPPANRQIPEIPLEKGALIASLSLDDAARNRIIREFLGPRLGISGPNAGGETE
jgi:hypothetical protein